MCVRVKFGSPVVVVVYCYSTATPQLVASLTARSSSTHSLTTTFPTTPRLFLSITASVSIHQMATVQSLALLTVLITVSYDHYYSRGQYSELR